MAIENEKGDALEWSADFEQGRAANVHLRKDGAIGFSIPSEPGGDEYLWFFFRVAMKNQQRAEFVLENAAGAHQTGKRWKITKPFASTDGRNWIRTTGISYAKESGLGNLLSPPVFRFQSPVSADTLWVAYFQPYTISDLESFLSGIEKYPGVVISILGRSEENRDIPLLRIANPEPAEGAEKQTIWVVCREHPGETPASFVCEGMIRALLDHPAGKRLRSAFSFAIVPMLNVDGVARGYYYHNARGVNLARDWVDFKSAEVRALRAALLENGRMDTPRLMLNLHSSNDPGKGHFFLIIPSDRLKPEDAEFQRTILEAGDRNHPQLQGHSTVKLLGLPGITGNALYRQYDLYSIYLESNYSRGADGSLVTVESLRAVGAALVQTLAEVLTPE